MREAGVEVVDAAEPLRVMLRLTLGEAGSWQLIAVEVKRAATGEALDRESLAAVPWESYLELAIDRLSAVTSESGRGGPGQESPSGTAAAKPSPPAPRRAPDAETLRLVAQVYREALASGTPRVRLAPTAAVARALRVDRTGAGRLVAQARRYGLLNPAMRRQPGEVPTRSPSDSGTA